MSFHTLSDKEQSKRQNNILSPIVVRLGSIADFHEVSGHLCMMSRLQSLPSDAVGSPYSFAKITARFCVARSWALPLWRTKVDRPSGDSSCSHGSVERRNSVNDRLTRQCLNRIDAGVVRNDAENPNRLPQCDTNLGINTMPLS